MDTFYSHFKWKFNQNALKEKIKSKINITTSISAHSHMI